MYIGLLQLSLFIFGLIIGSFLNVVILRLPKGLSLNGRSVCPHCHHQLSAADLTPLFSYLFLRGKCRYCKKPISPRYAVIEGITGVLFVGVSYFVHVQTALSVLELLRLLIIVSCAIVVFVVDLETYLILDSVSIVVSVLLIVVLAVHDTMTHSTLPHGMLLNGILGAFVGVLFLGSIWFFSKGKWMGFGDVKFMVPFGLALGFPLVLVGIFCASIIGSLVAIPLLVSGFKKLSSRVPFGVFLSVSMVCTALFGNAVWQWYMHVLGF